MTGRLTVDQPLLFQPVSERSCGVQEFELDDRAYRDDTGGQLI